jgi:hypothetical protein
MTDFGPLDAELDALLARARTPDVSVELRAAALRVWCIDGYGELEKRAAAAGKALDGVWMTKRDVLSLVLADERLLRLGDPSPVLRAWLGVTRPVVVRKKLEMLFGKKSARFGTAFGYEPTGYVASDASRRFWHLPVDRLGTTW